MNPAATGRRVGLFGGSFDPVHEAHLALARCARDTIGLHEVRFIPAGQPWQKARRITEARHRVAMLELAIAGDTAFTIDRIEIERAGPSYTLDTVRALRTREPGNEWVLIIGQDQYAGLHTWQGFRELLALVVLAVARRPGVAPAVHTEVVAQPHLVLPLPMLPISSTEIRSRAAEGGDISKLVPPGVARYIETHRLYAEAGAGTPGS